MNRVRLGFIVGGLVLCLSVALVFAAVNVWNMQNPTHLKVNQVLSVDAYLNSSKLVNNTLVEFGNVNPGATYTSTLDMNNTGNVGLNVTVLLTLGSGAETWNVGYSQNNTVYAPGEMTNGTLWFAVPSNATPKDYSGLLTILPAHA